MIPVGAPVIAWTNQRGPLPGIVRGSEPHASGARLYLVQLDCDPTVLWQFAEMLVFDITDIVRKRSQFSPEVGTS